MGVYSGFLRESTETIVRAFAFVKCKMEEYYRSQAQSVSAVHVDVLDREKEGKLREMNDIEKFVTEHADGPLVIGREDFNRINSYVRSALEIYVRDLRETILRTQIDAFDKMIGDANRILMLKALQGAEGGLFEKYYT